VHRNGALRLPFVKPYYRPDSISYVQDAKTFEQKVAGHKDFLIQKANDIYQAFVSWGGVVAIQVRTLPRPDGQLMAVLHILCNPAMHGRKPH